MRGSALSSLARLPPGAAALSVMLMGALMLIVLPFQIYTARRLEAQ